MKKANLRPFTFYLIILLSFAACSSSDDASPLPPAPRTFDFPNGVFVEAIVNGENFSHVINHSPGSYNYGSFQSNITVGSDCDPAYGGGLRNNSGGGIFIVFNGAARAYGDLDACTNPNLNNFKDYFPVGSIPVNQTHQRLDSRLTGGISLIATFGREFPGPSATSYSLTQNPYPQPNSTFEILKSGEKVLEGGLIVIEVEGIFDNITLYDENGSPSHFVEDGSFRVWLQQF